MAVQRFIPGCCCSQGSNPTDPGTGCGTCLNAATRMRITDPCQRYTARINCLGGFPTDPFVVECCPGNPLIEAPLWYRAFGSGTTTGSYQLFCLDGEVWLGKTYGSYSAAVPATSITCNPLALTFDMPSGPLGPLTFPAHTITMTEE